MYTNKVSWQVVIRAAAPFNFFFFKWIKIKKNSDEIFHIHALILITMMCAISNLPDKVTYTHTHWQTVHAQFKKKINIILLSNIYMYK